MAIERSQAVVLDVMDHGESDKIVTLYTPAAGKLAGIAKGAKRSRKRFVNKLEIFSWLDLIYNTRRSSSLVMLDEADLLDPFIALRQEYDLYAAASLVSQLVLYWTRENDPDPDLFALLLDALRNLSRQGDPLRTLVLFHIRLLTLAGYQPHLEGCMTCGRLDPGGAPFVFHAGRGGMLCRFCHGPGGGLVVPLSLATARLLHSAQHLPPDRLGRLRFAAPSLREAAILLRKYGENLLQRELAAWKYIRLP